MRMKKKKRKKKTQLILKARLCVVAYVAYLALCSETAGKRSYEVQRGKTEH